MVSVELVNEGRGIQIYCDNSGIDSLVAALEKVRSTGHLHLLTPSNGGRHLSEKTPWGQDTIGEVIITTVSDE